MVTVESHGRCDCCDGDARELVRRDHELVDAGNGDRSSEPVADESDGGNASRSSPNTSTSAVSMALIVCQKPNRVTAGSDKA